MRLPGTRHLQRPSAIVTLALASACLALAWPAHAQRKAEPPLRQPSLLYKIPEEELRRSEPRPAPAAPTHRASTPEPDWDRAYDPDNPGLPSLQKPHEALAGFRLDRAGLIDWSEALAQGRIAPRARVDGKDFAAPFDLDVTMRNTKEMPWVRFPHRAHSAWLDCANCHPAPFAERAGSATITMERIFRGETCGMCHGKVAFVAWNNCELCHSLPQPGMGAPNGSGQR